MDMLPLLSSSIVKRILSCSSSDFVSLVFRSVRSGETSLKSFRYYEEYFRRCDRVDDNGNPVRARFREDLRFEGSCRYRSVRATIDLPFCIPGTCYSAGAHSIERCNESSGSVEYGIKFPFLTGSRVGHRF